MNYRLTPELSSTSGDLTVGDAGSRADDWLWLASIAEGGPRRRLRLDITAEHVLAVLGKRGTGKSYTLGVLLEGLGANDGGQLFAKRSTPRAAIVFDVLDVFWSSAIPLAPGGSTEFVKQYGRMAAAGLPPTDVSVEVWL